MPSSSLSLRLSPVLGQIYDSSRHLLETLTNYVWTNPTTCTSGTKDFRYSLHATRYKLLVTRYCCSRLQWGGTAARLNAMFTRPANCWRLPTLTGSNSQKINMYHIVIYI